MYVNIVERDAKGIKKGAELGGFSQEKSPNTRPLTLVLRCFTLGFLSRLINISEASYIPYPWPPETEGDIPEPPDIWELGRSGDYHGQSFCFFILDETKIPGSQLHLVYSAFVFHAYEMLLHLS